MRRIGRLTSKCEADPCSTFAKPPHSDTQLKKHCQEYRTNIGQRSKSKWKN